MATLMTSVCMCHTNRPPPLHTAGYSLNVFYFEIAECLRKLSLVGLPVFFTSGSIEQLLFALIVCFVTFGLYTMIKPYKEWEDNAVAIMAQIIIFFALVSSLALAAASPTGSVARGMDIALTLLFLSPILFEVWIEAGFSCKGCADRCTPRPPEAMEVKI